MYSCAGGLLEDPEREKILCEKWLTHTLTTATWIKKQVLTQNWLVGASDMLGTGWKNWWIIATIQWWGCDATAKWDITSIT